MLKILRKYNKLTQKELAELTGISQSYISKLESNKFYHSPTVTQVIALSKVLKIDPIVLAQYFIDKEINANLDI